MPKPASPVLTAQVTPPRLFTPSSVGPASALSPQTRPSTAVTAKPNRFRERIQNLLDRFDFKKLVRAQRRVERGLGQANAINAAHAPRQPRERRGAAACRGLVTAACPPPRSTPRS